MLSRADFYTFMLLGTALLSVLTFAAYGLDKRRAVAGRWRLTESSLHLLSLFGGWPGAIAAQRLFRHKTQKTSFRLLFHITIAVHLTALFLLHRLLVG